MNWSRDKLVLLICVVLALATLVAYEPIRRNQFVDFDDNRYVTENPHLKQGLTTQSIAWAFTTTHIANWHPLTWLSHILDCHIFGLNSFCHHFTNLLFHIANTLLLFWLFKTMTGAVWRSAFVAALFALHPLHVESVAWLSERKDVLSTFFWMLTLAAYVRYAKRPGTAAYLLVVLFLALGLMAKPMLVTLPFVLLLLDYWPLGRLQWGRQTTKENLAQSAVHNTDEHRSSPLRLIVEKIPLFGLVLISGIITFIAQQKWQVIVPISLLLRIENALVSYIMYIEKMIWPTRLAILYLHPLSKVLIYELVAALFLLPLISFRVMRSAQKHKYLPVGWFWYLITLIPVIGFVQVGNQAMADRYTYVPSIGIFIIVAWGAGELASRWRHRNVALTISAAFVLALLMICTRQQVRHWQNTLTLFKHTVEVTKGNYVMHDRYGAALLNAGQVDNAITQFNQALKINPQFLKPRHNLGKALFVKGRFDEAVECFKEVLRFRKDWNDVYYTLGLAYAKQEKYDLAVQTYNEVLQRKPDYRAHAGLATVLMMQDRFDEAISHFREALRLNPNDKNIRQALKDAMAKQNKAARTKKNNKQQQPETPLP